MMFEELKFESNAMLLAWKFLTHCKEWGMFLMNGLILHYEYNGTADVCVSNLKDTAQEVSDNWRDHEWLMCWCGRDEPAIFTDTYNMDTFNRMGTY